MKFESRDLNEAADVSSGGGKRGMRRELIVLMALLALSLILIWGVFDGLSRLAVRAVTPKLESEWLGALVQDLDEWEPSKEADIRRTQMIRTITAKLAEHPDVPTLKFRLFFIDDESPNAFAIPGGVVGVTRGLVDALEDHEIAAAFVIAHEFGHFANRDHLRGLVREVGSLAALQIVFGGGSGLIFTTNDLMQLNYSRKQEEAADTYALRLLYDVYGHADGADKLFELLSKSETLPGWAYMFSTHPNFEERLERLRNHTSPDP